MTESDQKKLLGSSSEHDYGTSESRRKMEAALSEGKLTEALSHILEQPSRFVDVPLPVAVIGDPDTGKSSLIRLMQSPQLDEHRAFAPGIAARPDRPDPTKAEFPQVNFSEVKWNQELLRAEDTEGKEVDFKDFDHFIIVDTQICQPTSLHLLHKVQEMGKEFSLVQTKADLQLEEDNGQQSHSMLYSLATDSCRKTLISKKVKDCQIFAVSNKEPDRFDFPRLRENLKSDFLRKNLKANITALSSSVLDVKADTMKRNSWLLTIVSGFIAGIPVPGIAFVGGIVIFVMFGSWCCHKFGVDNKSLAKLAQSIDVVVLKLKSIMTSQSKKKMILHRLPDSLGSSVMMAEYFYWNSFPFIGCILSVVVSLIFSFFALKKLPSDVKVDTQNILAEAVIQKTDPKRS